MYSKFHERSIGWETAAVFCLLLCAYVLVLPPYEGCDEIAHYSYISYLADEKEIPFLGVTPLDQPLEDERSGLPRSYTAIPPYEENDGITYKDFSKLSHGESERSFQKFWSETGSKANIVPAAGMELAAGSYPSVDTYNWQAQHPPLFLHSWLGPIGLLWIGPRARG